MRFLFFFILFLVFTTSAFGQKELTKTLKQLHTNSAPYMYADELKSTGHIMILDIRKKEAFDVGHIECTIWLGYKAFEQDSAVKNISRTAGADRAIGQLFRLKFIS